MNVYRAGKVGLNYLVDRDIELDNLILMDYYDRSSSPHWQRIKRIARFTGEYAAFIQDVPRLPAMRLSDNRWSIVYAGRGQSLKTIKRLFFNGEVNIEDLGRVPIWKLPQLRDQWASEGAELIIQETSPAHRDNIQGMVSFRVPSWIEQILPLPAYLDEFSHRWGVDRDVIRMVRRIKTTGLVSSFSTSGDDFNQFYHQLYYPFIAKRHGDNAFLTPYRDLLRWFQRGNLIAIYHPESHQLVGGLIAYKAGDVCYAIEEGFIDDPVLWQQGINSFLYWSFLH